MTTEELMQIRQERGKQVLNIGDKVIAHSASDKPLYDGKVATIIEKGILGNEVYYGLYIEGVTVENRSTPIIGKLIITSLLAPFYAEDLELVKEPKPKFKLGDKVEIYNLLSAYDGKVGTIAHTLIGKTVSYGVEIQNDIIAFNEDSLAPYTEPTAEEDGGGLPKYATGQTVLLRPAGTFHKIKSICYRGNKFIYTMESGMEFEENVLSPLPESVPKIELTPDWQPYRMELAAKIAVVLAQKGRYEPSEIGAKAVEVANGVVEQLKNSKQ